jgi:hypothetical protein
MALCSNYFSFSANNASTFSGHGSCTSIVRAIPKPEHQVQHCPFTTVWARGYAVSTVGFAAEQMRRDIRGQEQLENQGEDEDDECSDSVRTVTLAALGAAHNMCPEREVLEAMK